MTPVFEYSSVFRRGIGDASDVVGKEMYEFTDRDGQQLALRPEGTASIVRAFVQHHPLVPFKAWYVTPAFRHERAQALRYRQHHQLGIEAIGTEDPDLDVEVITVAHDFFRGSDSSASSSSSTRWATPNAAAYLELLAGVLARRAGELCDEHGERFGSNPLRVLDCKKPSAAGDRRRAPAHGPPLRPVCGALRRVRQGLEASTVA